MLDCRKCPDFENCQDLCEEAEEYVSQDHHAFIGPIFLRDPRRDERPNQDNLSWVDQIGCEINLTNSELVILQNIGLTDHQEIVTYLYYFLGLTQEQVADYASLDISVINRHLGRMKIKLGKWLISNCDFLTDQQIKRIKIIVEQKNRTSNRNNRIKKKRVK